MRDREREKQEARERDERDLAEGRVAREELAQRNGFFSSLDIDWANSTIIAIGGKPIT